MANATVMTDSHAFPTSGRIDREWLETPSQEDPWLLVSDQVNNEHFRDALVANGLIGLRVPPEGEASGYRPSAQMPTSGCLMHGLWTDDKLMEAPLWHGLGYHDGQAAFARDVGSHTDYRQILDLRTATMTTACTWGSGERRTQISTELWLSAADPNLLVIETTIVPEFDGEVCFSDVIRGMDLAWKMGGLVAPRYRFNQAGTATVMEARMGERLRRIAVHAEVSVDGAEYQQVVDSNLDHTIGPREISRTTRFQVTAGATYRVRKVAALVSDHDHEQPATFAAEVVNAASADLTAARARHEAHWAKRWQHRIEVGNQRLQRLLNASLYQCYSQLPSGRAHSVGPAALSGMGWHGRAFWDADLWTFPVIGLLHPDLGRCFTDYRVNTLAGAQRNAAARGYAGACWAWESAETGDEKVPAPMVHHQRHINACVALAQWWDRLISGDEAWFRGGGATVIVDSARYFASRVHWNDEAQRYELLHIKCPDEFAGIRDNNATTNYSCVATLRMAQQVCELIGDEPDPLWQRIIDHMWIPVDEANRRILEYEGFDEFNEYSRGLMKLKQADATLLVYPWAMPMDDDIKANTLAYYRNLYSDNKIMMASAIDGIVDCELGDADQAWSALCDLLPHFRGPFLLTSESPVNECISFITGIGGLLQLVVMGFAGLRITDDGLTVDGCLPEQADGMTITGAHFGGKPHQIVVDGRSASLTPMTAGG